MENCSKFPFTIYVIETCQYKLKVCENLMNLNGFDDSEVDGYFDKVIYQEEFFDLMTDACYYRWSQELNLSIEKN